MIGRCFVELNCEKTPQRDRIGQAPSDAALAVDAFEVTDQQTAEVAARRQRGTTHPWRVELGTALFGALVKAVLVEQLVEPAIPDNVRRTHQSLHHLVADSPWSDQALLAQVRAWVLPLIKKKEPLVAWIVDDTGIPKKGKHSVGVAQQYCGQLGKQENCQVAVSLSAASWRDSLPIAWRLYLPESWARDRRRRRQAGVPDEVRFQTKPQIALAQIRQALEDEVEPGVVLADAAYGNDSAFRAELRKLKLEYVVGIQSTTSVWKPGEGPLPPRKYKGKGRPPKLLRRGAQQPLAARELALTLSAKAWKKLSWRQGEKRQLSSRFAGLRVRPDQQVVAVAARALSNPGELSLPARPSALAPLLRVMRDYIAADREQDADAVANFLARVKWDFEGVRRPTSTACFSVQPRPIAPGCGHRELVSWGGRRLVPNRSMRVPRGIRQKDRQHS